MKKYYKAFYGYKKMAEKLPCAVVKDMLDTMKSSSKNPKVTAYFTHSTMFLMIFVAFGNYQDEIPLMGDNYSDQRHRPFKTSKIAPYGASFGAVKYECSSGEPAKILFLHNQRPISMRWCKLGTICTINEIENYIENSTMNNCPCDICGEKFAKLSIDKLPSSLVESANMSCLTSSSSTSSESNLISLWL